MRVDVLSMFEEVVRNLWVPLLLTTLLILIVWAICRVGERHLSPRLRCYLWRLIYVKLLLTATVGVLLSGGIEWRMPDLPVQKITAVNGPSADVRAAVPALQNARDTVYRFEPYPHSLLWAVNEVIAPTKLTLSPARDEYSFGQEAAPFWLNVPPVAQAMAAFYCVGAALFLFRLWRSQRRARRLARLATPVTDPIRQSTLSDIARRLGLRTPPRLGQTPSLRSPLYTASTILLPTEGVPPGTERLILAHEAAHAHRRDLIWEWMGALVQALYFFHPLIYVVRREERIARESAADAVALELTGASPADYARMLIALSLNAPRFATGTVGAVERGGALHRRLRALQSPVRRGWFHGGVLFGAACLPLTAFAVIPVTIASANIGTDTRLTPWQPTDDPFLLAPANPLAVTGNKRIYGVVRDSHGKPLRGAYLSLFRTFFGSDDTRSIRVAVTGADGRFDFKGVPMGRYSVLFGMNPDGNAPPTPATGYDAYFPTFYVPSSRSTPVEVAMTAYRGATIRGRLLDRATRKPIAGIAIGYIASTDTSIPSLSQDKTDAEGRFALHTTGPGRMRVAVGTFSDMNLSAASFRVAAAQTTCTVGENEMVTLPDLVTDRLRILHFVDGRHRPLGRIRVTLTPSEPENLPNYGNFDSRGAQRPDADEQGDFLIKRLHAGAFAATTTDGRFAVRGTFHQLPGGGLTVTGDGAPQTFADGIATIVVPPTATSVPTSEEKQ